MFDVKNRPRKAAADVALESSRKLKSDEALLLVSASEGDSNMLYAVGVRW